MDDEKAGLLAKLFFYNFDIASDWLNGYWLTKRPYYAPSNTVTFTIAVSNNFTVWTNETIFYLRTGNESFKVETVECPGDHDGHPWKVWGATSISLTWLPSIFALIGLLRGIKRAAQAGNLKKMSFELLLLPIRLILWPFLVSIRM